ncbi:MAG: DUF432 domain-containing protein [Aeropyrum sp.]|nr:DUF432 domain-containing protein [Aeropyrum sp.]MCE4616623.1 DUF432 domain-containing protein [Aeropyrum sp.]
MKFGFISEGGEVKVSGRILSLRSSSEGLLYERMSEGGEVEFAARVGEGARVLVAPYPPFLLPLQGRLNCLYVRLSKPLVLPPGSKMSVPITLPYDIAIIASSRGSYILIDTLPPEGMTPKMAVYGSNVEGVLCRFWSTSWGGESARGELVVDNPLETQVVVTRVVMPRRGFTIYYNPVSEDVVASTAVMNIKDIDAAEVSLRPPEWGEGYSEVPTIERDKRLFETLGALLPARIEMMWGI